MYQVLYRKWRPKSFSDVVGQPQVTETLKNELTSGRVAHAYLFTGSRGTGKTTCAKILAKAVNCLNPKDGDPCGECEICRGIDDGSVMDIVEIDAASNNGVDSIRTLREEANFTPAAAKYRVYIIDEVHMLSVGAFNALLKTLEEPPAHVIFILATTEVHKLPATILSRCQRFDFHRIPPQEIAERLTYVAEHEDASIEPQAALLIARLADGALRDALSILDQCFGRAKTVTEDVVVETAGLVGRNHLFELADAVRRQDSATALEMIDRLHASSKDMARLCEELSSHFRSLMLIKTMKEPRSLLAVTDSEYGELTEQSRAISIETILHAIDALQATLEKMFRGGDRRVEFELAMIRLCSPRLDTSAQALLRRIEALEHGAPPQRTAAMPSRRAAAPAAQREEPEPPDASGCPEAPVPGDMETPQKRPASSAEPEQVIGELKAGAEQLTEWPEIVQALKSYSHTVAAAFNGSTAYLSGEYVLIDAPNEIAFKLLRKPEQRENMRKAIQQVTGRTYNLGPYRKPKKDSPEDDPLAQLAQKAENQGIPVETK
ncbi:Holliday junction ATP-dependent DNA helicase RuvB [Caprobacter fermentans]|uniref:DNA-directed DNA polymerase n=1 Tax=Caproicibacter fermentans TaxID=2576756 RepID=A0A6N8I002_9FIRM|nr:DNA polymerase III subunit gamma/tau [Caproicibacter fermentans]MVB11332.1 Holliday junction ATP-dependent DNA helicase RuvB [Caproicibacter fermentans]